MKLGLIRGNLTVQCKELLRQWPETKRLVQRTRPNIWTRFDFKTVLIVLIWHRAASELCNQKTYQGRADWPIGCWLKPEMSAIEVSRYNGRRAWEVLQWTREERPYCSQQDTFQASRDSSNRAHRSAYRVLHAKPLTSWRHSDVSLRSWIVIVNLLVRFFIVKNIVPSTIGKPHETSKISVNQPWS